MTPDPLDPLTVAVRRYIAAITATTTPDDTQDTDNEEQQ